MLHIHCPGRSQPLDIETFINSQKTLKILKSLNEEESLQVNPQLQLTSDDIFWVSDIGGLKNES